MSPEQSIDEKTVDHLAVLARIKLEPEERKEFARQLSSILSFFSEISELDTENVEPTYHVLDVTNVFRDDVVTPSLPQEKVLENAPSKERGFFKAPKIVD